MGATNMSIGKAPFQAWRQARERERSRWRADNRIKSKQHRNENPSATRPETCTILFVRCATAHCDALEMGRPASGQWPMARTISAPNLAHELYLYLQFVRYPCGWPEERVRGACCWCGLERGVGTSGQAAAVRQISYNSGKADRSATALGSSRASLDTFGRIRFPLVRLAPDG